MMNNLSNAGLALLFAALAFWVCAETLTILTSIHP